MKGDSARSIAIIDDIIFLYEHVGAGDVLIVNIRSGEEIVCNWDPDWLINSNRSVMTGDPNTAPDSLIAIPTQRLFILLALNQLFIYDLDTNTFKMHLSGAIINSFAPDGCIYWEPSSKWLIEHAPKLAALMSNQLGFRAAFDVNGGLSGVGPGWLHNIYIYDKISKMYLGQLVNGDTFIIDSQQSSGNEVRIIQKLEDVDVITLDDNENNYEYSIREYNVFYRRCIRLLQLVETIICHATVNPSWHCRSTSSIFTDDLPLSDGSVISIEKSHLYRHDYNLIHHNRSPKTDFWTVTTSGRIMQRFYIPPIYQHLIPKFSPFFPESFPTVLITMILEFAII